MSFRFFFDVLGLMGLLAVLLAISVLFRLLHFGGSSPGAGSSMLDRSYTADVVFLKGQEWGLAVVQGVLSESDDQELWRNLESQMTRPDLAAEAISWSRNAASDLECQEHEAAGRSERQNRDATTAGRPGNEGWESAASCP